MKKLIKLTFIILTVLLFMWQGSVVIAQCNHPDDYTALRALYLATDGDNWTNKTGWPTRAQFLANPTPSLGTDMSGWYGIYCNGNRVTTIDLDGELLNNTIGLGNNLKGTIPSELEKLLELKFLSFSSDNFIGSIPNFNLPNLQNFILYNTQLTGSIPNFNLPNLIYLYFAENQLTGSIPNFNLPNLEVMILYGNQLSDSIPNFNLPNLQLMMLSDNKLSGSIPNFYLPKLKRLILNDNLLTGTLVNFNLPKLEFLDLKRNRLNGVIPDFNLPILTYLNLDFNQFTGTIPHFNLPSLQELWLRRNQLNGIIPQFNLPKLTYLVLGGNQLTGNIPNFNLPNMEALGLGLNQLTGSIPNFYMPKLKQLGLNDNQLTGSIPDFNFPDLYYFQINNNQLEGCIPLSFKLYCDSIIVFQEGPNETTIYTRDINFSSNPLLPWQGDFTQFCATDGSQQAQIGAPCDNGNPADGTNDVIQDDCSCGLLPPCNHPDYAPLMALYNSTNGPGWTNKAGWEDGASGTNCDPCNGWYGVQCDSGRVETIVIRNNNLSGFLPKGDTLAGLDFLRELFLSNNKISGEIPSGIGNIKSIETIEIIGNLLIGSIPENLGNAKKLRYINLRSNKINGVIPDSLMTLGNLYFLDLRGNNLTGSIPENINKLKNLSIIDLYGNNLSGQIPSSIGELTKLGRLNLGQNNISGSLPSEISSLTNLISFDIGNNEMIGEIPFSIGNLSKLTWLNLSGNLLTGSIPVSIGNVVDSCFIILNNNNLSECFPNILKKFCGKNFQSYFNPFLPWQGDFAQFCATDGSQQPQFGAPCNNGNPADGTNDVIDQNCNCVPCPTSFATINGDVGICEGSSTEFTATGGTSYLWTTGQTTDKITVAAAGSYSVTVTNAFGCTSENTKTLEVYNAPTATITGIDAVCAGESATFAAAGGISYLWSNGATTANITVNTAGTYSVTVTDAARCEAKRETMLTFNAKPSATINGANEICEGSSTELTATGGTIYLWNTTEITDKITVNAAGSYSVTVTDANGCTSENTKSLAVNNAPTATITGTNAICQGESVTFTAVGGTSYIWSNGATTEDITVNTGGTYSVTVIDAANCEDKGERILTINPNPTAVIAGANSICIGSTTTLTTSGGTDYEWSTGNLTNSIDVGPGTYTVTVSNVSGCTGTTQKVISTISSITAFIVGDNSICEGETTILTASGGSSYVWNTGATSMTITINSGGNYTVSVTNNNGCVGNTSFRVNLLDDTMLSQTKNDTLYVDQGSSYQVDLLQNDILFTDSVKVQLFNIPESFIRILSFDEKGRVSLEVKEVFIETLEISYEVCDPCNPCVSGKLIILNEKLKKITQTTLMTPLQSSNNTLQFSSEPIPESELWIYNRWGQQIHHSKNYQNDWNASGYPGGVYFYVFKVYGFTIKRALTVVK